MSTYNVIVLHDPTSRAVVAQVQARNSVEATQKVRDHYKRDDLRIFAATGNLPRAPKVRL